MEVLGADKFGTHGEVLSRRSTEVEQVEKTNQVLIRVAYSELNPVDLQKLKGNPQQTGQPVTTNPPFVPGYGGSGIIESVGEEVPSTSSLTKGKRVAFLADPSRRGSYASLIAVDYRLVSEIPTNNVSLREAATVPLAGCTAYESLTKLGLQKNSEIIGHDDQKTLLVVGGAGGVGGWAISLARAWHSSSKLRIVATASSDQSKKWCRSRGANEVIGHDEIVDKLGGGREGSVSHILCLTEPTPSVFGALTEVIQPYGTICLVVAGESIKSLDLGFCFFKAANVVMETVFSSIRNDYKHIQPSLEISDMLSLLSSGSIRAPLSPQLEGIDDERWESALKQDGLLDILSSGHTCGKLVMQIGSTET